MVEKPDAGALVDQMAVPILPDDRAIDVFRKVTVAAELVLERSLGGILDGTARLVPQDLAQGGYFGRRTPEDGRIDWRQGARAIHDLVRAVAPPYPGAFTDVGGRRLRILRTRVTGQAAHGAGAAELALDGAERLVARCADGGALRILEAEIDGVPLSGAAFLRHFGRASVRLGEIP
jgi:methionyl-tRNA formyltransferase